MLTHIHTKKTQIMRAALQLVAEQGVEGTTTMRISKMAAVAEGSIYRHFSSKDDLLIAVYRQIKAEVFAFVSTHYQPDATVAERFSCLWQQVFLAYREDLQCLVFAQKFSESELMKIEDGQAHKPMAKLLTSLHQQGTRQGVFKPLDSDLLIALFYAPIIAMLRSQICGKSWSEQQIDQARMATLDAWLIHKTTCKHATGESS